MQTMSTETSIGNRRSPVVRRMDADYDAVRSLYNGMIDKSPMMIARCTDVADVVASVPPNNQLMPGCIADQPRDREVGPHAGYDQWVNEFIKRLN